MIDSIQALIRENKDVLWGSMVKQTMQRKQPSFNEGYYGYGTFSELLEDAERKKLIQLKKDAALGHLRRHRLRARPLRARSSIRQRRRRGPSVDTPGRAICG